MFNLYVAEKRKKEKEDKEKIRKNYVKYKQKFKSKK